MRLLLATFAMGVLSAVFPLVNMETYIAGIAALIGDINIWLVAFVAGVGQSVGKIPWYEVSRRSMDWAYIKKKMAQPGWQSSLREGQGDHRRPAVGRDRSAVHVLARRDPAAWRSPRCWPASSQFNRFAFHATIVIGRTLQFAALLGGVAWLTQS